MTDTAKELLKRSKVGRMAMSLNNKPYVIPFNYGFDENYIYLHTSHTGKKIDILKENPNVCFEVDELIEIVEADLACNWTATGKSVVINGIAEFVTDEKEKVNSLNIIMEHYSGKNDFDYTEMSIKSVEIIKIKIEELTEKRRES